jgi:hypothetical protein
LTQRKAIGAPARRTSKVPKNLLVNEPTVVGDDTGGSPRQSAAQICATQVHATPKPG